MSIVRICFFGDSITVGTGDGACRGWPSYLCEASTNDGHDISCYNLGIRAETSVDVAKRWRIEAEPRLPPHVNGRLVFSFGLNDGADALGVGRRVAPEDSLSTVSAMLAEAAAWQKTLWVGMTPPRIEPPSIEPGPGVRFTFYRERMADLNERFKATAAKLGIDYIDLFSALEDMPDWNRDMEAGDGVHPTAAGHQMMADIVRGTDAWQNLLS
ncbi:MAG: GDSL-type esterase/lipase family protein [Alphaproteobacteria bacterium]